ncbi:hypothetical protein MVEN_01933700 [Mycena venus]|uniref:ARM repeat-containing protein n=1 Tax=Mycena venus TaxID=2733690 RepID=A0A8H7CLB0_9AGAR|nr:hypothetical protein MVEN_01933700 [Mycena venus]
MQPLARQSRISILSWWSDHNPGLQNPATINIHAASKPLARWMYYRQAVEVIRKSRSNPLSTETLEIYSSYFPWNFVSWSTKAAILSELADRTASEVDARAVLDSPIYPYIAQMLRSSDTRTRSASCRLLGTLASHDSTALAILESNHCEWLVFLMCDKDSGVAWEVMYALAQIANRADGAQAIVETDAKVLDRALELLNSPSRNVRQWTGALLEALVRHEPTTAAILELNPCERLVSLMRDANPGVTREVMCALSLIARDVQGIVEPDAKVLNRVLELLNSPSSDVRECACKLVGRLAMHEAIALAILELRPCAQLVLLLRDMSLGVVAQAAYALSEIAQWLPQAILDAKALDHVIALLDSPSTKIQEWTCKLLGNLLWHEWTVLAILDLKPCEQLVSLMHAKHSPDVISRATCTLAEMVKREDGAHAAVNAKALDNVAELLVSSNLNVRKWTCVLLGRLAGHESTAPAIMELESDVYVRLVVLLREPTIRPSAIFALGAISEWSYGVAALHAMGVVEELQKITRLSDAQSRVRIRPILGSLARHKSCLSGRHV